MTAIPDVTEPAQSAMEPSTLIGSNDGALPLHDPDGGGPAPGISVPGISKKSRIAGRLTSLLTRAFKVIKVIWGWFPGISMKSRIVGLLLLMLPPLLLGGALIALWYYVSLVVLDAERRFMLPQPHDVLQVGFLEWDKFSVILSALWSSTKVAMIGLAVAISIGLFLATLMSQAKTAERALFPYMVTVQAIPILAIVPLISFWFGTGQPSRVIVCIIISLFPIIVNTLFGLQSAERGMHDLFTLHHAGRLTRLQKLMFPAALPAVFAGLRISAGLSVIGAIVGDFFFARGEAGIGQRLRNYASRLDGEELLTAVIMSSALGVIVFWTFGWIQKAVIGKWHEPEAPGS